MHLLTRICLQYWYLVDAQDIEIRGATAFIGPTGAGKSSLQDAIQTVHQGNNHNRLHLNSGASGRSARTVKEYCLGMTKDAAEGGRPLREACESVIALVYRDEETDEPITVGIALAARATDAREEVLSRFILPGYAYSVNDAKRREGSREYLAPWKEIAEQLRRACPSMEEYKTSAEKFTSDVLRIMRRNGQAPNAKHFQRTFSNALAFKPIFDSTGFVREFVLEPEPLDVERVRVSIQTWQDLERIIADIEARLRRVTRLSDRFRNWGRARIRSEAARLASSIADCRRAAHEVSSLGAVYRGRYGELQVEKKALQTRRQYVRELDEEYRAKQMLVQAGGEAARLKQLEMEGQWIERERRDAEQRLEKLRNGVAMIAQLGPLSDILSSRQGKAVKSAQEAVALLSDGKAAYEALRAKGERLQELVDDVMGIDGLDATLNERADTLADEVRQLQAETERLEGLLKNAGSGQALLSQSTMKLLDALAKRNMEPVALCDVVDVVEEEWQDAVETLLGWGREAIIVSPEKLSEAHDLAYRERDLYAGCTLVKTTATKHANTRIAEGSILEAVRSDNLHAVAFMNKRIGSFMKAYTDEELMVLDRGVTRSGKSTSGMGLSVQANLRQRMFGRAARDNTLESLRNDLSPLSIRLARARQSLRLLREASRMIPVALEDLRAAASPFDLEHEMRSLSNRQTALAEQKQSTVSGGARDLLAEIESIESDRRLYVREIEDDIEPAVERLQAEAAAARAKLDSATESLKRAVKERRRAWAAISAPDIQRLLELDAEIDEPSAADTLRRIRAAIRQGESEKKDARQWLASFRNDQKVVADNNDSEARREQSAAVRELSEYAINWQTDVPEIDADTMTVGYAWTVGEKARLEKNELRRYRLECERAAVEMKRMLKEDLLARLAEKLIKVQHRLDTLNNLLDRHRFTNQIYSIESQVNQAFRRMHDLAMKIGGQADSSNPVSLDDHEIAEAVAELEGMIDGGDDTKLLADYRQYFTFEIIMTDRLGSRTTLSSRAVKGSGGEAQAPFYVLIAVSLASTYFPGHGSGRPSGMGLAMFDEAFNKLDIRNTQALLKFFHDMGLQILIAGPEDKRPTFTEVLDTIVLVNKNLEGTSVYIDSEHPMSLAKAALQDINPDHRSIESIRPSDLPAAE